MAYTKSVHRRDFEARAEFLIKQARAVAVFPGHLHAVRDLTFQSAIFLTSAAIETYVKLLVETWVQNLKGKSLGDKLPDSTRGFIAVTQLRRHFDRFAFTGDESTVLTEVVREHRDWPFFLNNTELPIFFDGKSLHSEVAYPSQRNLKRLFNRLGIPNLDARLSALMRRDVDTMIAGFQSVRTALAHSAPPSLTVNDVKSLISDMRKLIAAIDRVFYQHVLKHGGGACWQ